MSLGRPPQRGNGGRVSFLFPRGQHSGHCAGVNALTLSDDEQRLWTGSRDSTVACWDVSQSQPALMHEHTGHIDWVNDLVLVDGMLVSCSNDKTLRLWQPDSPGPSVSCLTGHTDYVTCLAASSAGGRLASGGLRGEVLLLDLATLRNVMARGSLGSRCNPTAADVPQHSVYAMAMNAAGTLLATGSSQALATLVDVRNGQAVMQLKGHTDNIRAALLDADGRLLLTGSSDHTIRLWDLGQQRCVQTMAVHTDSVWALAASASWGTIYSGGRDGCIYRTRLATRVSELLAREEHPVQRLVVSSSEQHLWVATTDSSVHKWPVEGQPPTAPVTPRSPMGDGRIVGGAGGGAATCFVASPSAAARARMAFDLHGSYPPPQQLQPAAATPGIPPIQNVAVLTDRRHVLTRDAEGQVQMWDVTAGTVVREYGRCDLKEVERRLFEPSHSVSAWFAPEVKLGCLAGSMEAPQCFGAEIYAVDLGDEQAPIDLKVNFGEQMLKALFGQWAERRRAQHGGVPAAAGRAALGGDADAAGEEQAGGEEGSVNDGSAPREPSAGASRFTFQGRLAPVVMVSGGTAATPWRCSINALTGEEDVPQWVSECVLHGHYPVSKELKMAFQLVPLPGSGLPSLLQSKLNAPRVLRINKVADYLRRKLEESNIVLREEPLFWDTAKEERWQVEQAQLRLEAAAAAGGGGMAGSGLHPLHPVGSPGAGGGGGPKQVGAILITCGGHAVPWDFSLAAVRQWIWRRSDDLVLHYSVRDNTPLRLPAIRPPS